LFIKWSVKAKWLAIGLVAAFLLIIGISIFSYQNATKLIRKADQIEYAHRALKDLIDISVVLIDAESGRRGYILLGNQLELARYQLAVKRIQPELEDLYQLAADQPERYQLLEELKKLISERLAILQQSIELYQVGQLTLSQQSSFSTLSQSKQDEINSLLAHMQRLERQKLRRATEEFRLYRHYEILLEIINPLFSTVLLCGVYLLLYQQSMKRLQSEARQRAIAQEKEMSELKLRFFSMISHEFRTPLSIILGSTEILSDSARVADRKQRRNLERIQSSAQLLHQLLNDLMTLSKAEAGQLKLEPKLLNLESLCLNLIEDLQASFATKPAIKFSSYTQTKSAVLDEKLLYSILSNLLSNAIKYSLPEQEINFTLDSDREAVIFQIQDRGIGISAADQESLYQPFYRGRNIGEVSGTGLGLAVVKRCVERQNGQIFVNSVEGVGTTFTVKLPLTLT
jgi:signal transduction histidine kinase